jgi:hypothetical protein
MHPLCIAVFCGRKLPLHRICPQARSRGDSPTNSMSSSPLAMLMSTGAYLRIRILVAPVPHNLVQSLYNSSDTVVVSSNKHHVYFEVLHAARDTQSGTGEARRCMRPGLLTTTCQGASQRWDWGYNAESLHNKQQPSVARSLGQTADCEKPAAHAG